MRKLTDLAFMPPEPRPDPIATFLHLCGCVAVAAASILPTAAGCFFLGTRS